MARPSDAYMRRWTDSSSVQVIAWHMYGTKLYPEPIMTYRQMHPW